jgi:hypothetical protein
MFERGRAHPILGPILLVVLVLLLAMVFLHFALEGVEAAADVGAMCVAIATALGLLVTTQLRRGLSAKTVSLPGERAPPRTFQAVLSRSSGIAASLSIPLRR